MSCLRIYEPLDTILFKISRRDDIFSKQEMKDSERLPPFEEADITLSVSSDGKTSIDCKGAIVRKTLAVKVSSKPSEGLSIFVEELPLKEPVVYCSRVFNPGEYLIKDGTISEVLVTCMASSLLSKKLSYNFIKVYGVETKVKDEKTASCSIYMERLERHDWSSCYIGDMIQVFCAMHTYQHYLSLQHNDITIKNILERKLTPAHTFRGETLHDAKYFRYVINDTELYIPNKGYILCVSDYGTSSLWGACTIAEKCCYRTGYLRHDGREGRCLPRGYCEMYDLLLFMCMFRGLPETRKLFEAIGMPRTTPYYRDFGTPKLSTLKKLSLFSVDSILTNDVAMKDFMDAPPEGDKVVTLSDSSWTYELS
jgi:hypothetical protein